jgi:hypothetical protein
VPEVAGQGRGGAGHAEGLVPVQQQVVVVQQATVGLAVRVGAEHGLDVVPVVRTPGEALLEGLFERPAGVHAAGVDRQQRALLGEPLGGPVEAKVGADEVEQILGVALVENDEVRVEAQRPAVQAQQPVSDAVEGPAPDAAGGCLAHDPAGPAQHLGGGPPGEREQEDAAGVGAGADQGRDAGGDGQGLATAGPGDDEQRPAAVLGRGPLLRVQLGLEVLVSAHAAGLAPRGLHPDGC